MLERISVPSILITFNGSQLRCLFPERIRSLMSSCPKARARTERAYFLSAFSAAIARVAASITFAGARAMPSL